MNEPEEVFATLESVSEIKPGALFVNVDFNALLEDRGEAAALDLVGKLKDLLT